MPGTSVMRFFGPGRDIGVLFLRVCLPDPYNRHPVETTWRSARGHARGAAVRSQVKSSQATLGMLHAGVDQKRLKCNVFKTIFRSARLGRARCTRHARGGHGITFPGPRLHADDQRPCSQGPQMYGSSVRIDRETCTEHPHSVASTVGAPSCCGCWTRDWRAPSLPQVGTITVLNCVMAGAPASASRTPL